MHCLEEQWKQRVNFSKHLNHISLIYKIFLFEYKAEIFVKFKRNRSQSVWDYHITAVFAGEIGNLVNFKAYFVKVVRAVHENLANVVDSFLIFESEKLF